MLVQTERGAVIVGHDRSPGQVQGGDDRGRLVRPLLRRLATQTHGPTADSATSQVLAPALARRHGLLQTMLVPHLVSNVLLLAVTVAPSFRLAALLLAARHALSKIDVPARQAFTAAVVPPQQRTAAASLTTVARSVATSASPLTSSLLLSGPLLAVGAPLLAGGALALTYDVTMWCNFRSEP